jgi:hypothetical protein
MVRIFFFKTQTKKKPGNELPGLATLFLPKKATLIQNKLHPIKIQITKLIFNDYNLLF